MRPSLRIAALALAAAGLAASADAAQKSLPRRVSDAITELDVGTARKLLKDADAQSAALAFERARLAIYSGDCESASAILASPAFSDTPEGGAMYELAKSCSGASAGALIIDDERGVRVILQDDADRALVPRLVDVTLKSSAALERDLGVRLPKPVRVHVVRDLFSLSAVTGLPLEAAETTGTVAVARWGRVSMISPRATRLGYPWEDTLAHELTHLALTRASRDRAPLWLQEGIAKRSETRWRSPRPFDDEPNYDRVARDAQKNGESVGINGLGKSIAMLPTPKAASIAYAEVSSFMSYWVEQNGNAALRLLLADLRGSRDVSPDDAMRSVTGYDLGTWDALWRQHLANEPPAPVDEKETRGHGSHADAVRHVRLGDMLAQRGHAAAAAPHFLSAVKVAPADPSLRWRHARALLDRGDSEPARDALGTVEQITRLHAGWFALHGRFLQTDGKAEEAGQAFRIGVSLHPYSAEAACEGYPGTRGGPDPLPSDPARRTLCEAARSPVAGTR